MKPAIMILALLAQVAVPPDGAPRITQKEFSGSDATMSAL